MPPSSMRIELRTLKLLAVSVPAFTVSMIAILSDASYSLLLHNA